VAVVVQLSERVNKSIAWLPASAGRPFLVAELPPEAGSYERNTHAHGHRHDSHKWDEAAASGLSEPDLLRYRSNLLGSDLRITNYGVGNTSAKVQMDDPLSGEPVDVLWVKGSGGDLGSMALDGFATLYRPTDPIACGVCAAT
jgi:hypothetical protein